MQYTVLQIRKGNLDNLGITSLISPQKQIFDPSLEPSRRDGSYEWSQQMFSLRNKKNIIKLCSMPPLIWSSESVPDYSNTDITEYHFILKSII